jgi:hypothetical protein
MRSKNSKGTEDSQGLIREAMKNPGVAEVVRIYAEYEKMILRAYPQLRLVNTPASFSTTDSKSY